MPTHQLVQEQACISSPQQSRIIWLDLLRVVACLMVVGVHASAGFVFNEHTPADFFWGNLFGSLCRPCVPLFIMLTGYLLIPMKGSAFDFLKHRLIRILLPFLFWSVFYGVFYYAIGEYSISEFLKHIITIPFAFSEKSLHLWYIYMLVGLYLMVPIVSPWVREVSKKGEFVFLAIWVCTMFLPFARKAFSNVLGEAGWNQYGMLHYFAGYLGYMILSHFLSKHVSVRRGKRMVAAAVLFMAGFTITFLGQKYLYGYNHKYGFVFWGFLSLNVMMMTAAVYLFFQDFQIMNRVVRRAIADMSAMSFFIYFVHFAIINKISACFDASAGSAAFKIPLYTVVTFLVSYGIAKSLSYIPKSKYITG